MFRRFSSICASMGMQRCQALPCVGYACRTPAGGQQRWTAASPPAGASADPSASAAASERVINTALKLTAMRKVHRAKPPEEAARVAKQAWRDLQLLPDDDVDFADGRSVSQLLVGWAYFSRYWEKGRDGPSEPLPLHPPTLPDDIDVPYDKLYQAIHGKGEERTTTEGGRASSSGGAAAGASRFSRRTQPAKAQPVGDVHQAPRANPLDESLEM